MNFAIWSIRNPIPSILLFLLLSVAGLRAFTLLPVQDLPDMSLPSVSVVAMLPGATPEQLETEIARPIEDSLSTIDGMRHLTTSITEGLPKEIELRKKQYEYYRDMLLSFPKN